MTQLRDRLKDFLKIEGDPYDHCLTSMQSSGSVESKALDVFLDCHEPTRRDRIAERLTAFGFPKANQSSVRIIFTNPNPQVVSSSKAKESSGLVNGAITDEIFNLVQKRFREQGLKNLVVKGDGFIRVQTKEMARKAANIIKTLSFKAKPICKGEDIILFSKDISQKVDIDVFMSYMKEVLAGVFGLQIMDPIKDGNSVIIGFPNEKELEDAKLFLAFFEFQEPRRHNQTLILLPEEPSMSIEDVRAEWLTKKPGEIKAVEEKATPPLIENSSVQSVSVSPEDFKKSVREFLKRHDIPRVERGTIQEVDHFHYKISIEQEHHEKIMDLAKQEHPEWLVEKARRSDTAMNFFHSTYYTQPSSLREHHEPETVKSTQALKVTGEGITVTLQMIIPEEKMQEIMKQAPDNFITKEAQERGLFSSRKEILDTITEEERALLLLGVTNAELIAEAKRRGSDFAKQLLMDLL
jgi:hypothetical protein